MRTTLILSFAFIALTACASTRSVRGSTASYTLTEDCDRRDESERSACWEHQARFYRGHLAGSVPTEETSGGASIDERIAARVRESEAPEAETPPVAEPDAPVAPVAPVVPDARRPYVPPTMFGGVMGTGGRGGSMLPPELGIYPRGMAPWRTGSSGGAEVTITINSAYAIGVSVDGVLRGFVDGGLVTAVPMANGVSVPVIPPTDTDGTYRFDERREVVLLVPGGGEHEIRYICFQTISFMDPATGQMTMRLGERIGGHRDMVSGGGRSYIGTTQCR